MITISLISFESQQPDMIIVDIKNINNNKKILDLLIRMHLLI